MKFYSIIQVSLQRFLWLFITETGRLGQARKEGGRSGWIPNLQLLFFWDRLQTFRPCVLISENVPAETL